MKDKKKDSKERLQRKKDEEEGKKTKKTTDLNGNTKSLKE